ncbi:MAG: ABC transporter ATP-binding protein [Oscillospiraceae bacterium]|nr:ABC transporter ATP-binding protein [Oscillospiraceae bacterium]
MREYALELAGLTKIFVSGGKKSQVAVNNLDLVIPHGSVYGFLGRNGAGKTTALKMIAGLCRPTAGEIRIYGEKMEFGKPFGYKNIGYLPDVPEFYSFMTARQYLFLCGRLYKMSDSEIKGRIGEIFELINFDKKRLQTKISAFSRGMKQKLGIAAALLNSPELIMLDEPTSALDPIGRKETISIMNSLRGRHTIVFSTHILNDAERVCDRIALIEKGSLALEGGINDIKAEYSGLCESLHIELLADGGGLCEKFFAEAQKLDCVNAVDCKREDTVKIRLKTSDRKKAGEVIPKMIYENNLSLIKFEFEDADLEDIFISATSKAPEEKGGIR